MISLNYEELPLSVQKKFFEAALGVEFELPVIVNDVYERETDTVMQIKSLDNKIFLYSVTTDDIDVLFAIDTINLMGRNYKIDRTQYQVMSVRDDEGWFSHYRTFIHGRIEIVK